MYGLRTGWPTFFLLAHMHYNIHSDNMHLQNFFMNGTVFVSCLSTTFKVVHACHHTV